MRAKPATSHAARADATALPESRRPIVDATAKNTKAPCGQSQRNVCGVTLPNTVTGPCHAVTNAASSPAPAVAIAHDETRSRRRSETHAHHPSAANNTTSESKVEPNDGSCQPGAKASFIDGRNHHGGSDTTVATTRVPKPRPIVPAFELRALSTNRVRFPEPSLVNCSMSGWIQHTARTTPATATRRSA